MKALVKLKESPWIGFGFQADRLILGTHLHNAWLQALFQTGILGFSLFLIGTAVVWKRLLEVLARRHQLPSKHRLLVIQAAALFVFLTVRGLTESSGTFYGIDWFLMAPLILYIQLIGSKQLEPRQDIPQDEVVK